MPIYMLRIVGVLVVNPESIYRIENFQRYNLLLLDEQRSVLHDQGVIAMGKNVCCLRLCWLAIAELFLGVIPDRLRRAWQIYEWIGDGESGLIGKPIGCYIACIHMASDFVYLYLKIRGEFTTDCEV